MVPAVPVTASPVPRLGRWQTWLPVVALAGLIVIAVALRLTFVTGMVHSDSLASVHAAHDLSTGRFFHIDAANAPTIARLGLYVPTAIAYRLFGINDVTSLWWPFVCSLGTLVLIYVMGARALGVPGALVAAYLWAVLPQDIQLATSILPDGPLAMFCSVSVLAFWCSQENQGRSALLWGLISVIAVACALLVKQTALITVGFLVIFAAWRGRRNRLARISAGVVVLVALAGFFYHYKYSTMWNSEEWQRLGSFNWQNLARTSTDWYEAVVSSPAFLWLVPLTLVSIAVCLVQVPEKIRWVAAWLFFGFLAIEFGSRSPFSYEPMLPNRPGVLLRQMHFVLVPAALLVGAYLGRAVSATAAAVAVFVAASVTLAAAWAFGGEFPTQPAWVLGQNAWTRPYFCISSLAAAGAIFGGIASPMVVIHWQRKARFIGVTFLLASLGLASLRASYEASVAYMTPQIENARTAAVFLLAQPDLPWLVQNDALGARFDYLTKYTRGYSDHLESGGDERSRLRHAPPTASEVKNAYVIVDESLFNDPNPLGGRGYQYLALPPPTWWEMARFGKVAGQQMRVYRVLAPESASRELVAARAAADKNATPENLRRLAGALANAGDYCGAARREWVESTRSQTGSRESLVTLISSCAAANPEVVGPNLLNNGDFSAGFEGWYRHEGAPAPLVERQPGSESTARVVASNTTPRAVLSQRITFIPDHAYVFQMSIRSTAPVVALYWESDVGRFETEGKFPEWTHLRYVFVTPHWDGKPRGADVFPFLLSGAGEVLLRNVRLASIDLGMGRTP